jgi:hypothetical protein
MRDLCILGSLDGCGAFLEAGLLGLELENWGSWGADSDLDMDGLEAGSVGEEERARLELEKVRGLREGRCWSAHVNRVDEIDESRLGRPGRSEAWNCAPVESVEVEGEGGENIRVSFREMTKARECLRSSVSLQAWRSRR